MRKLFLLPLVFLAAASAYGQTSANGRIMEGPLASRPAVCSPGDYYVSTDTAPVVEYKCSTGNNWAAEATGGGGGSPSAGTNGTVQCSDGAGNYIACHVNDNVTFPGALFVNENQIVSGALTVSGNGAAGNVPIKPNAGPIIYVATWGNDSNDGLSWGTAKQTIYAAWNTLPTGGCGFGPGCGGTIYISDNVSIGGPVSGQGLWILGASDPNFASPPSGFLKEKSVVIACGGVGGWDSTAAAPLCVVNGTSNTNPALWISGSNNPMEFDGIKFVRGSGSVLAMDSNGVFENSAGVSNKTFRACSFSEYTGISTNGPGLREGPNSFENYFYSSVFDGNPNATGGTEDRQAFVMDPGSTLNNNAGQIYLIDSHLNSGGLYVNPNGQGSSGAVVTNLICEGQTDGHGCIWLATTNQNAFFTFQQIWSADSIPTNVGVEVDGNGPPDAVTVNGSDGVSGPMVVQGNTNALFFVSSTVVSPDRQHQNGFFNGHVLGQTDAARRGFSPVSVAYPNIANTVPSGWTVNGTAVVTTGITAPDGTTGAATCSAPSGNPNCYFYNANQTIAVGDIFVVGGWARARNSSGFSGSHPFGFSIQSCGGCTFADISGAGGNSTGFINQFIVGDGSGGAPSAEWEWYSRVFKITAGSGLSNPQFIYAVDSTHPADFYGPMLLHISTGTISDNEAVEVGLNLQPYLNTCTVTQLCNVAGVVTGGGGSGNVNAPANFIEGQNIVAANATVNVQSSSAQVDFVPFFTTDWGTTVQTMLAGLPTANTKSYVTLAGTLTGSAHNSNVNPFVNLSGDASIFAQLPCYFLNLNGATSQWLINANDVVLSGCGIGGNSILTANGSFPTNTPMLFFGSSSLRNGVRLENYRINCGTVTGCTPLVAENQQEMSGVNHDRFVGGNSAGATAAAVEFEDPNGGGHYLVNDIEIDQSGANDFFYAHSEGASGALINRMTCNNTGFNTGLDCFHEDSIDGNPTFNFLNSAHGEGLTYVAEFANHTGGSADHIDCTGTCTDVLHIDVGALVVDSNYLYCSACTNIVNDLSQSPNVVLPRTSFVNGIAHYSNGPEFAKSYQAAAITDTGLTAGQSVCTSTNGLLTTSGCPAIFLANRVVSGTTATDTILAGDCFNRVTYQTSVNVAVTLPTPTTLGIAGCALRLVNATTGASTAITVTPTTLTIGPAAAANFQIQKGQFCTLTVDGTNWDTDCTFASTTNCASSASPAVCGAAAYGSVAIPTGAGSSTLTINTTAVTANSVIVFYPDDTLGTKLGVTCNSTLATLVGGSAVTARTAGTSFQITFNGTIATNPVCGNYEIVN